MWAGRGEYLRSVFLVFVSVCALLFGLVIYCVFTDLSKFKCT